jgi:hypothetical protein
LAFEVDEHLRPLGDLLTQHRVFGVELRHAIPEGGELDRRRGRLPLAGTFSATARRAGTPLAPGQAHPAGLALDEKPAERGSEHRARPAEAAPTPLPSAGLWTQPVTDVVPPERPWGERTWGHLWRAPGSLGEAERYSDWRRAREEALIRDLLPPGVSPETPPRERPLPQGPRWPGFPPVAPQPIGQRRPMLNRELLRRLLLTGGV